MKNIGIIGSGDVGRALANGFLATNHKVMIGSREPDSDKLRVWKAKAGNSASTGSFSDAAKFGDIIVLATKWEGTHDALKLAGPANCKGKTVIDVTNPLVFAEQGKPPHLALGFSTSGGEQVQHWLPGAKVVKAFNIIGNPFMYKPDFPKGPPDMFICGDEDGKKDVLEILKSFGWPQPIDLGGIEGARLLEPLAMIWILHGFRTNTWQHAFKLLRK